MSKYNVGDRVSRKGFPTHKGTVEKLEQGHTNSGKPRPAARVRWDHHDKGDYVYSYLFEELTPLRGSTSAKESVMAKAKSKKKASAPAAKGKECECGCGRKASEGSRFLPGHDMKLKSKLIQGAKCGNASAIAKLKANGWPVPKKV